jgi:selenocysteine lyase/cysteine desulfurase
MMPGVLSCQRDRFDIPDDVAYFSCAYGVHVGRRGGRVQVSPHLYNDEADVHRLFAALEAGA